MTLQNTPIQCIKKCYPTFEFTLDYQIRMEKLKSQIKCSWELKPNEFKSKDKFFFYIDLKNFVKVQNVTYQIY